jgi:hypothetical protein
MANTSDWVIECCDFLQPHATKCVGQDTKEAYAGGQRRLWGMTSRVGEDGSEQMTSERNQSVLRWNAG